MALKIFTAPAEEPVSLVEAKEHLRLESDDLAEGLGLETSIGPGSHVIAAAYSLVGTAILVSGYDPLVYLISGTNGAGGAVDAKIQQSQDNVVWSDVTGGAFTQVTTANDNAIQEYHYTGSYSYIRVVATVAGNACEFACAVLKMSGPAIEDDVISGFITAARVDCEKFQNRAYVTQTWELWLDKWPDDDRIEIPLPPLQSITSIKYYDTANVEATFAAASYFVDIKSEPGRVVLAYGASWPSTTLRPANGVCVTFVAGYGVASAVPKNVWLAMLLAIGTYYNNREDIIVGTIVADLPQGSQHLLWKDRIVPV